MKQFLFAGVAAMVLAAPAFAAPVTYDSQAAFLAALGGAATQTQDFAGYAPGTNLSGVEFLPGVSGTTNDENLRAFMISSDTNLFASGGQRALGGLFYQFDIAGYNAVGFDIEFFDPAATAPGVIEIIFADMSSLLLDIFQTNPLESDPIFFGIISALDIVRIIWNEAPEVDGFSNEETGIDNFIVANVRASEVPLPAAAWLFVAGVGGLSYASRKKAKQARPETQIRVRGR